MNILACRLMKIAKMVVAAEEHRGNVTIVREYVTDESSKHGDVDESMTEKEEHPNVTLGEAIRILVNEGLTEASGFNSYYSSDSYQSPIDGSYQNTSGGVSGFSSRDEEIIDHAIENAWEYENPGDVDDMIDDLIRNGSFPKGVEFDWDTYTVKFGDKEYEYDFEMSFEDNLPEMKAAFGI